MDRDALLGALDRAHEAQIAWRQKSLDDRGIVLRQLADLLEKHKETLARTMTLEMGKVLRESEAEIAKCADLCRYCAEEGPGILATQPLSLPGKNRSHLSFFPLGLVLGVMPWNFPFWQVFRFGIPALMAGNGIAFKPAPNVPQCALHITRLCAEAGFPEPLVQHLFIEDALVAEAIAHFGVQAVTVTGSERAGRAVASLAGAHLKKCLLELGGSDPFIVLADADLEWAVRQGISSRYLNSGQTCIAAKRFILVPEIADEFIRKFLGQVSSLVTGDPLAPETTQGPMARQDLRNRLDMQVRVAVTHGARCLIGGRPQSGPGWFYEPTVLDGFSPASPVWNEEMFGPVALMVRARNEQEALELANHTPYGLGSSLWSSNEARAEELSARLEFGCTFINGLVRSDPHLPFGGIKQSGFGRELGPQGLREFTNQKTVWIRGSVS